VKEAAEVLGVSERCVYGYIESGKLAGERIGQSIVIRKEILHGYQRPAVGRPRTRTPIWRKPVVANPQQVVQITARLHAEQAHLLAGRLREIRAAHSHLIPGTVARYITRSRTDPDKLVIMLSGVNGECRRRPERQAALARCAAI